ncbi:hypothetical protein [Chlorogloea sp. CCALA 695]|uniref:hypothetical protein n=1 Tax=Chlorogloea sp. CCALA 695 TaxID=2107693 RepID=UPI000D056C5E|nr:hypothetical protein [Chlorogloea sp. CCALA 695]PSB27612.1 hypothetical protein C7B70_22050 [Chlorogloea sp. CCALA 695]
MRFLFLFLPAVVIPLTFQIMSLGQPFSTTTVDAQKPLPPLNLLPPTTPVAPKVFADHPPTSAKKQSQKVIARKHSPKAKSSKSRAVTRPYTAPAIEIRAAVAQNVSSIAIASSTSANIIDGNRQSIEPLLPGQSFQITAHNSTILFKNW